MVLPPHLTQFWPFRIFLIGCPLPHIKNRFYAGGSRVDSRYFKLGYFDLSVISNILATPR